MVPAIAGLGILAIGSIMTVASSLLRTGERTIPIATITQTADKSLGKTAATLKQSGRSTHQYKSLMRAGLIDKTVPNCTCASAHSGGMWYTPIAKSHGATFLSHQHFDYLCLCAFFLSGKWGCLRSAGKPGKQIT
jgi:hypothetical protein